MKRRQAMRWMAGWWCVAMGILSGVAAAGTLEVRGEEFLLDGKAFDMWGIRVASAAQREEWTEHLIAQLDEYRAHGVNTVSVYYQGSSGGYSDPFSADGQSIDVGHQRRMERIIRACDERGMVVVVGIFYQRCDRPGLRDWAAAQEAVRTVTRGLRPWRNVIINIANEQNSGGHGKFAWGRVRNVADLVEMCRIVKEIDGKRIVGGGGYDHAKNEQIGRAKEVDVLLFDTSGPGTTSGQLYRRFAAAGVKEKPMVNVETFGAWTNPFLPQGVFPQPVREAYFREVAEAAEIPGLYVHFHNTPWCQAFAPGERTRYDLGGDGSAQRPGIRWYFEQVRAAKAKAGE